MEELASWQFLFAGAVVALAGIVRGFAGFGSAMIITPAFSALYGPTIAVPTGLIMELLLTAPLMRGAAPLVEWRRIGVLTVAAGVTVPIGAYLLFTIDAQTMRWAISAIVLICVALLSAGWRYTGRPSALATVVTGATSGLLNGAAGIGGPPIVFYYLSGPEAAKHIRASFIVYFALIDIIAMAALWWTGGSLLDMIWRAALFAPIYLGAAWIGASLFGRASEAVYRKIALVVLASIAVISLAI